MLRVMTERSRIKKTKQTINSNGTPPKRLLSPKFHDKRHLCVHIGVLLFFSWVRYPRLLFSIQCITKGMVLLKKVDK